MLFKIPDIKKEIIKTKIEIRGTEKTELKERVLRPKK